MKSRVPGHPSRYKYRKPGSPSWHYSKHNKKSLAPQQPAPPSASSDITSADVLYETTWENPTDGWTIAARGYARAMQIAGLDVQLRSAGGSGARVGGCYLLSTTLDSHEITANKLKFLCDKARPRIFYTTFERQQVDQRTATMLNELEAVWVPCTTNASILKRAGVNNVAVFPHVFFDDDPLLSVTPPRHQGLCRFYWIGRWEPRKAPHNLIRAFFSAFTPSDDVELVLKLSPLPWPGDYQAPETVIEHRSSWPRNQARNAIKIIRGALSRSEMVRLHAEGDVYVSASRGEGWDLPSFEAKLAGRRVITTDCGGPLDFVDERDIVIPPSGSVPADPLYRWGGGATYIDYDPGSLIAAFRRAHSQRGDMVPLSTQERLQSMARFNYKTVGVALRTWIEQLPHYQKR